MSSRREGLSGPYFNHHKRIFNRSEIVTPRLVPGEKQERHRHPTVRAVASVAMKAALVGAIIDPFAAHYEASLTEQRVVEVIPNLNQDSSDTAINVSAGFGLRNSSDIAAALSPFSHEGAVLATVYNNEAIDGSELASTLLKKAEDRGITKMNLWGDSMGGMLSLEAAVIIRNSDTPVWVPYVVLENSPSSLESIRPAQRENGQLLLSFTELPLLS